MRRGRRSLFVLITLAALLWAARAVAAADEPHLTPGQKAAIAGEAQEHPPAEKAGEPPIFTPVRIDLGVWTLVVFLLLFFILAKYAWGPMLEGLQRREQTIRGALEDAQRARDEAQRVRAELEQQLARANEQVRDIIEEGRRAAERTHEEMTSKARAEIQAERERAHREIELATDQARHELASQTIHLATLVASKALRRQVSLDDQRQLVEEALAELNNGSTARG
jgi:F-type H+-transporting ATPase subunit b